MEQHASEEEEEELEYEMEVCHVTKDLVFHICTILPPPLEYLTRLRVKKEEISGRRVWSGSLLLSVFLRSNPHRYYCFCKNKHHLRTLELGSGTGILGMTLSTLIPPSSTSMIVCMTDGDAVAVDLLQQNLQYNQIDRTNCDATRLVWGEDDNGERRLFEQFCQQKWPMLFVEAVTFDMIFAGDVLYKQELIPLLFATVHRYLSRNVDGCFYLCHIPRNNVSHQHVIEGAHRAGLKIKKQWQDVFAAVDITLLPEEGIIDKDDAKYAVIYQIIHNNASN